MRFLDIYYYRDAYSKGYQEGVSGVSVTYYYHHHTLGTIGDADSTDADAHTYSDDYLCSTAQGCFTTYSSHTHTNDCYQYKQRGRVTITTTNNGWDSNANRAWHSYTCPYCGQYVMGGDEGTTVPQSVSHNCTAGYYDYSNPICGKVEGTGYVRSCGKSDGEMSYAQINF